MNDLNSILIEGNLVRDPEIKELENGSHVCNMTIACNRYYKKDGEYEQDVSFFEVTAWNNNAKRCSGFAKGRGVRVIGYLKQDRWVDNNGDNRTKIHIIADQINFKPEK